MVGRPRSQPPAIGPRGRGRDCVTWDRRSAVRTIRATTFRPGPYQTMVRGQRSLPGKCSPIATLLCTVSATGGPALPRATIRATPSGTTIAIDQIARVTISLSHIAAALDLSGAHRSEHRAGVAPTDGHQRHPPIAVELLHLVPVRGRQVAPSGIRDRRQAKITSTPPPTAGPAIRTVE